MNEDNMQHGVDWNGEDLTGYILTEKLNGCRAYWDGNTLWSRGGIAIKIPAHWRAELPGIHLDCELYDGIDGSRRCASAIKYGKFTPSMGLGVFDAPQAAGHYSTRLLIARLAVSASGIAFSVESVVCTGNDHALRLMREVQARGGEGLVARDPNLLYAPGRTRRMLKVKSEPY